jgi:hypothetical protein
VQINGDFIAPTFKLGTNSKKLGFSPAYNNCMAKAYEIYIHPHHKWWGYETHFIIPRQLAA